MTHHDPTRPEFGYVPSTTHADNPHDAFMRATEAADRARANADREGRHLAEIMIDPAKEWAVEICKTHFRRALAAEAYAAAVYEVAAAPIRARAVAHG